MPLDKSLKSQVISDNARADKDTGSPEVQISIMQARIKQITEHLQVGMAAPEQDQAVRPHRRGRWRRTGYGSSATPVT